MPLERRFRGSHRGPIAMRRSHSPPDALEQPRVASEKDFAEWRRAHRMAVEATRALFDQQMVAIWRKKKKPPSHDGDAAVHALALRAANLYALCFSRAR
jgi:hypothetical protein